MKQVVIKKGEPLVYDIEPSQLTRGTLLVEVRKSCISPGTEITTMDMSAKSLFEKSKSDPSKVKRAIERMKKNGVLPVIKSAIIKQNKEILSGYSAAGIVVDLADDVKGFKKGMRVAVAGAGHANHAEFVVVPVNLAIPMPDNISFSEASTCALGGIALQGVRRADVAIGEINAVVGCGAIGLITVQLLKAAGCNVIAIDLDNRRIEVAKKLGADFALNAGQDNLIESIYHYSDGYGVDKAIITASTKSNTVLSQAFRICRKKGRVVLVGVVGNEFNRSEMYQKELDFLISTSYGPGRYDDLYEKSGIDYPYAFVRWTEKRNIETYLKLISNGSIQIESLIEANYPIEQAAQAFDCLKENKLLLATIDYDSDRPNAENTIKSSFEKKDWRPPKGKTIQLGLVGAGSFVHEMHIPNLKQMTDKFNVAGICTRSGITSHQAVKLFSSCHGYTNIDEMLDKEIDSVLISTRHNTHAELAIKALEAGKAVFVEKPMCITRNEYEKLCKVVENTNAPFMVGYNRRFSPFAERIHKNIQNRVNPLILQYTMNAGYIPYTSWVHSDEGGGRIIGEACHILDLFRYLIGSRVVSISVDALENQTLSVRSDDNVVATIKYEDGSLGTILYTSIGSKKSEKETLKVFCDEQIYEVNDYLNLKTFGNSAGFSLKKQDKGHLKELEVFSQFIRNGERFPIPWNELKETWEVTYHIADKVRTEA